MIRMDVKVGTGTRIWQPGLVNLYGCTIGEDCNIGSFVEIGPGVIIGNRVRIAAFCFIPEGVLIEDDCFIGPGVIFTNDPYPPSGKDQWRPILVERKASIGAGSIILPGVVIGRESLIGAGSVISRDVAPGAKVYGQAARERGPGAADIMRVRDEAQRRLEMEAGGYVGPGPYDRIIELDDKIEAGYKRTRSGGGLFSGGCIVDKVVEGGRIVAVTTATGAESMHIVDRGIFPRPGETPDKGGRDE